ncbi:conserved hypothetical protein [Brochothrix thermosphacta]|uniref:Uncharacterized protein n=1 Tax=Brochothrix thermosphacta TaxID=2756 RepID=A0A2X0QGD7_BROTH|nr:hypothetical protein FM106_07715 [Brachybacterium faecium]SPN75006.1 conserved hypothetical protein [Brochothrix thermosphacta]SPP27696.1 conserved hypothetical protein [Brochothrix thermosphacta]SPP30409.1 conserved hypothetical protein [Brochothrix thermosphacta]
MSLHMIYILKFIWKRQFSDSIIKLLNYLIGGNHEKINY